MARIPKQRVIFDAGKYDLNYLRETRDSYSPMTGAEFEDSISYDMGEDDLLDLMEMNWRSNEKALDDFLGKSILVRYSPVNYDDGFVQFNLNDLDDLLHTYTSPLHRVDKVWDEDGHLFLSGRWPDNSPLLVEVRKLTDEGERAMDGILAASRSGGFDAVRGTFHAMWDDHTLVSPPRYAELALGMPAEESLAPLPLDLIGFAEEITEYDDKLNFYIPVTFDCDAVFGTDACSPDNDDYLNIYVDYDMRTGEVAAHLDISLNRADGRIDELSYPLDDAECIALLPKMDAYCRHETGKGIAEYAKEVMGEPEQPVSLKAAVRESREASAALAGNDAHENIGQDAR
ncbi:hypothetical protein HIU56_02990 [Enterococcus faecium]|uniref:hypothetical protein n=1 Tax=Enterococcus faecium TaxID=1352 RepID=UPI001C48DE2D|nr:hypothetical protein [Enterococcus faecium]